MKKIRTTSNQDGFRRGGVTHSTKPKVWAVSKFTEQQLAQIEAEPKIVAEIFEEDESEDEHDTREDADRLGEIVVAIKGLDTASDYTVSDGPKVSALAKALGFDISADERDEAWKLFQTEQE